MQLRKLIQTLTERTFQNEIMIKRANVGEHIWQTTKLFYSVCIFPKKKYLHSLKTLMSFSAR